MVCVHFNECSFDLHFVIVKLRTRQGGHCSVAIAEVGGAPAQGWAIAEVGATAEEEPKVEAAAMVTAFTPA